MKTLLNAIKDQLSTIAGVSVCIVPHTGFTPVDATFPLIGIHPGEIVRDEKISRCIDRTYTVYIAVSANGADPETVIESISDITEDIHEKLDDNELNIDGVIAAFCREETEIVLADNQDGLCRKVLKYEYEAEGTREG